MSKSTIRSRLTERIKMCYQWTKGYQVIHRSDVEVLLDKQMNELFTFLENLPRYTDEIDEFGKKEISRLEKTGVNPSESSYNMAAWMMKDFIIEELKKQFNYEKE